jgi:hypothetical protein
MIRLRSVLVPSVTIVATWWVYSSSGWDVAAPAALAGLAGGLVALVVIRKSAGSSDKS